MIRVLHVLHDLGIGGTEHRVLRLADGLDPARITKLFLTHYHADHAGGASHFQEKLGVQVAIASDAKAALESGDEDATSLAAARSAGIYADDYKVKPCQVADALDDGAVREIGKLRLQFVSTPGHCHGHGSYLLTGGEHPVLFAGDSVFWAGQILLQAIPDCDLQASLASVLKLEPLQFEAFLPGHGAINVAGGHLHVELAAKVIRNLAVPRNLI